MHGRRFLLLALLWLFLGDSVAWEVLFQVELLVILLVVVVHGGHLSCLDGGDLDCIQLEGLGVVVSVTLAVTSMVVGEHVHGFRADFENWATFGSCLGTALYWCFELLVFRKVEYLFLDQLRQHFVERLVYSLVTESVLEVTVLDLPGILRLTKSTALPLSLEQLDLGLANCLLPVEYLVLNFEFRLLQPWRLERLEDILSDKD